jgi:hypothetical protein
VHGARHRPRGRSGGRSAATVAPTQTGGNACAAAVSTPHAQRREACHADGHCTNNDEIQADTRHRHAHARTVAPRCLSHVVQERRRQRQPWARGRRGICG